MTSSEKIEVGKPVRDKDHVLFPIARTSIVYHADGQRCWCHCSKQLYALVLKTASGIQAFDLEIGPIPISELITAVPELEAYLQQDKLS